ncbi:MAG: STAS/SEC14 domain-containing protein [Phycisphaerales bacterium JB040]
MLTIEARDGRVVEIKAEARITHADYQTIIPELERIIEQEGAVRFVLEIPEIESIEPRAILDDLEFDLKHMAEIERCAVVTDTEWMQRAAELWGKLMPRTQVRTFPKSEHTEAQLWVRS